MFTKATKAQAKLRMAIAGPSGGGKTYTALAIAQSLANGKNIAVVDTEHGSASKYADIFSFDVAEMRAPFHPQKFIDAIGAAAAAGYGVLILDSLSHAWNGPGGLLEIVDEIAKRMKTTNTFAAWKGATPIQNALIEALLSAPLHIICTMRSKQEYVLETVEKNGRMTSTVRKVGMAPIQRDGFEYEFDVFLDMDLDNNAIVSKTRCPALTGKVFAKPGKQLAQTLNDWLQGEAAPSAPAQPTTPAETDEDAPPDPAYNEPPDESFDESVVEGFASDEQLSLLEKLGVQFYGTEWQDKLPQLVLHVSAGTTDSVRQLLPEECAKLIQGLKKRVHVNGAEKATA